MPQATDIVLNGAGYMVLPGKYERAQDGIAEGRTGRVAMRDFFGGLRRHMQLERDRAFDGLAVGPVLGGQGVSPWGARATATLRSDSGAPLPAAGTRIPGCVVDGAIYFARGPYLYRTVPLTATSWAQETLVFTAPATIVDITAYASNGILLTFGTGTDIVFYSVPGNSAVTLLAGERGRAIAGYAGYAVWADARMATKRSYLRMVHGMGVDTRILDYDIRALVPAGAKLYAVTASAVYSFTGRVREKLVPNPAYDPNDPSETDPPSIPGQEWEGEWTPYFQHGVYGDADDFSFFVGYGGRILTWVAGSVMEDNPGGDRAGWRDTGLRGRRCFGGTVAGGFVVVAIESLEGASELWAWDGAGWWALDRSTDGRWVHPIALAGAGGYDLLVFREGETTAGLYRLRDRGAGAHALPAGATFVTPLIDAGERDKAKAWRKAGAVFATPERLGNLASVDAVSVALDVSTDGGATWTEIAAASPAGNTLAANQLTLDADIASAGAVSRFLMLRVRWAAVVDWAPVLAGIWAEFEVLDSPARRRRWRFAVRAEDQVVDRAGSLLARTGRELIAELWAHWEAGTTLPFRDIDYDASPVERRVRIVGISEVVRSPADAGRWGDAEVALTLIEV